MELMEGERPPKEQSYLSWMWNTAKTYTRKSYYATYIYGLCRGLAQPYISTTSNINHIEDGVYIGDIASASKVKELKTLGITHIITAVLGVSPSFPGEFTYLNIPIMDVESENIIPYLDQTTRFIDDALANEGKVLVHCVCGVSRSAAIVTAWLMKRHGKGVDETIELIKAQRGCVDPNSSF